MVEPGGANEWPGWTEADGPTNTATAGPDITPYVAVTNNEVIAETRGPSLVTDA